VCNKVIYTDSDYIVMVVGGPNQRHDYHVNQTEELFYQVKGDMLLKVIEAGKPKDITIKEGQLFLLPANMPHSPQRFENTAGLVIEIKRPAAEQDRFQWYCQDCGHKLYETSVHIDDIVTQLPKIFEQFASDSSLNTCSQCGSIFPHD